MPKLDRADKGDEKQRRFKKRDRKAREIHADRNEPNKEQKLPNYDWKLVDDAFPAYTEVKLP